MSEAGEGLTGAAGWRGWRPAVPIGIGISLGLLLLFTRLRGLAHSLWWDEAYTAWAYVRRAGAIRSPDHYLGNNHVLFSFLTNRTTEFFGTTAEPIVRLWSVVPGLIATALLVIWLWRRSGPNLALTTLGILYLSVLHARHIPEARGYGLVFLGSVALLAAGSAASEREARSRHDVMFVAGGAIGVAAIPTLAFAAAPQAVVAMLTRRVVWTRLAVLGLVTGGVLAWWYWPLREPMLYYSTTVGARSGDPVTWANFPFLPAHHLATGPLESVLLPLPGLLVTVVAVAIVVLGCYALIRDDRPLGLQAASGMVGAMALVGILGVHAHPRYLLFLLPHVAVALAAGLVWMAQGLRDRLPHNLAVAALSIVVALALVRGSAPVLEEQADPRQAFADSLEVLLEADVDTIYSDRLHIGYRWYLGDQAGDVVVIDDHDELVQAICGAEGSVGYLPYPRANRYPDPLSCFDQPAWESYDPPSFHPTTVWFRPEAS